MNKLQNPLYDLMIKYKSKTIAKEVNNEFKTTQGCQLYKKRQPIRDEQILTN